MILSLKAFIKQLMKSFYPTSLVILLLIVACSEDKYPTPLFESLGETEKLAGKPDYLKSPFVTAGDRVYMVGHQDGTFPDLGWHVEGEMGGIWNHPIKLMDGFTAAILDEEQAYCLDNAENFYNYPFANEHHYNQTALGLKIIRFQFVPDSKQGLVVEYTFENVDNSNKSFQFEFAGHTDLMPVWLGEKAGMTDQQDVLVFDESRRAWRGKDEGNEWYVLFGSNQVSENEVGPSVHCSYDPQGKGESAKLLYNLNLKSKDKKTLRFYIAGSYTGQADVEKTYDMIREHADTYLTDKEKHYKQIASLSKISIPDKELEKAYEWVKYNTEWLVRDVPEVGRGLGAGMPDYPWWFGVDNEYTLKGAIVSGRKDLVYATIDLIHKLSEANESGKIIHEVSTNAIVFNPGNINETPQFASLIYWVYQWTGDREFLGKYFPTIKKGLKWLMEEKDADGNLFPDGYGMMEIHGLESEMIDVATYTQQAFADAAAMAGILGESDLKVDYQGKADSLKIKINEEFWVDEFNSYADFIGTRSEALKLLEAAIVRADTLEKPWAVDELKATRSKINSQRQPGKSGYVIFHNWVVNTPMEMGIADEDKAIRALDKGKKFVNPYGVFVTGIDRDEASEAADGTFVGSKVFSYTGAVMTLPTGVQAIAENNYGRPDMALDYLKRMTRSFGFALPGSIYEVSPDYGMMAQAWNLYSFAVPIVTQFFGIKPDAANKVIHISPLMPTEWKQASIEKVIIGDNELSMYYSKNDSGEITVKIDQKNKDWEIRYSIGDETQQTLLNGGELYPENFKGKKSILFSGKSNQVSLK